MAGGRPGPAAQGVFWLVAWQPGLLAVQVLGTLTLVPCCFVLSVGVRKRLRVPLGDVWGPWSGQQVVIHGPSQVGFCLSALFTEV